MTAILPVSGENFHVTDMSRPEVISNPYPYYDLMRDRPIEFGYADYPPGTVKGLDTPIPSWAILAAQHCPAGFLAQEGRGRCGSLAA